MNAITFIVKEHRGFKKAFTKITKKSLSIATKKKLFAVLSKNLVRHEKMEQTVWYPNFKTELSKTVKLVVAEEHAGAKAIKSLKKTKNQKLWEKKLLQLKKAILHHASDEEKKLFPKVRKVLTAVELKKIGKQLQKYKARFNK